MAKFNYNIFEEELEVLLSRDIFDRWEAFGIGHYRINGIVDIWPRRKKFFHLYAKTHGTYTDLENLINSMIY